ncbi:beta-ketoacyl-[acyl-carrier-protein] synthase family protein [Photobacterium carnosum]|uniref:beta-ketoacyl-[acyl-carrier-protein] synthase family protein n=1 Tax=Photobacterium carnosum TaxID=2023717 RepID=UPI001E4D0F8D|nr:beta-ketoacyl-[acyl-carrier-protein] synthase family protein [Photobacterium carnosum]MCD9496617.1 beta-ketoacyl-ACP synthase II [Photobacterium carnosum]
MKKINVVVTGLGILNSAGLTVQDSWNKVLSGEATASIDERLKNIDSNISCPIKGWNAKNDIDPSLVWRIDKFIQYAVAASKQALIDAGINFKDVEKKRIGVIIGNSLAGISTLELNLLRVLTDGYQASKASMIPAIMNNMAASQIALTYGIQGPTLCISTACASGADAIGLAKQMIESDQCDIIITGATEAPICPLIVSSFNKLGALSKTLDLKLASRPFDKDRNGFVISEGAGILILESETFARRRKAKIYATVSGYGTANDAFHATSPSPDGTALKLAIYNALENASISANDIDSINAHGTSTVLNDSIESKVIFNIFGSKPIVTSTKGVTGHSLGATGAIEAIYSILSIKYNKIPPIGGLNHIDESIKISIAKNAINTSNINVVMSNSIGFGGQNSTLIFSAYKEEKND